MAEVRAGEQREYTLRQLVGYFLRLGCWGFGGPVARPAGGAFLAYAIANRHRPWIVLPTPVAAILLWIVLITLGGALLNWTA